MAKKQRDIEAADDKSEKVFGGKNSTGTRVEIARQPAGEEGEYEYFWLLYSKNGKVMATGPEPHKRLNDLKKTLMSIDEQIGDAPIVRLY